MRVPTAIDGADSVNRDAVWPVRETLNKSYATRAQL